MRLILSRKGFDSSSGGCASPILPGGRLFTLPIPSSGGLVRYRELRSHDADVAQLVFDLTDGAYGADNPAHLDPDLWVGSVPRPPAWRPAFGQVDKAQIHLANQGVDTGDLFLFFGWFREVEQAGIRWIFRRGAPDLHVLFGWLQVGEVLDVSAGRDDALFRHPWLRTHPHLASTTSPNVVYVATERLKIPGIATGERPGAGVFPRLAPSLVLTQPGQRLRSRWWLPPFFYPRDGRPALSYHGNPELWTPGENGVGLKSVGRGQEFVLDLRAYPEAIHWALNLIGAHGS